MFAHKLGLGTASGEGKSRGRKFNVFTQPAMCRLIVLFGQHEVPYFVKGATGYFLLLYFILNSPSLPFGGW
jgi:hypothetical protein